MKRFCLLPLMVIVFLLTSCAGQDKQDSKLTKANLYYIQGTKKIFENNYTQALQHLLKAYELAPNNTNILNNLGMAYHLKGKSNIAINFFRKSIAIEPENIDAQNNLASTLMHMGKLKESRSLFNKILGNLVYEKQYRTYFNLALIDMREGQPREAKKKLVKAVKLNEQFCPAHYKLGELAAKSYDWDRALKYYKNGIKGICFQNRKAHMKIVEILLEKKEFKRARQKLLELMERFKDEIFQEEVLAKLKKIDYLEKEQEKEIYLGRPKLKDDQTFQTPVF